MQGEQKWFGLRYMRNGRFLRIDDADWTVRVDHPHLHHSDQYFQIHNGQFLFNKVNGSAQLHCMAVSHRHSHDVSPRSFGFLPVPAGHGGVPKL